MSQPRRGIVQVKTVLGSDAQSLPAAAPSTRSPSISSGVPAGDGSFCRKLFGIVAETVTGKLAPGASDPISHVMRSRLTVLTMIWSIEHLSLVSDQESPAGSVSTIFTPFAVPVPAAALLLTVIVKDAVPPGCTVPPRSVARSGV